MSDRSNSKSIVVRGFIEARGHTHVLTGKQAALMHADNFEIEALGETHKASTMDEAAEKILEIKDAEGLEIDDDTAPIMDKVVRDLKESRSPSMSM